MSGPGPGLAARLAGIAAASAVMVAVILAVAPGLIPSAPAPPPQPLLVADPPIAAEADAFRTRPRDLASGADADRRPEAHPRTLALYRRLRAFPGAPPRVPHGLTAEEFKGGRCNTCHARGGFVERFASYAPVTPHPELSECLQCHVADGALVGRAYTAPSAPGDVCFQCHVLDREPPRLVELDWAAAAWPELADAALPDAPPPIPHDLQMRGNCLACHMGTAAIDGLRTSHPERADCRQCHVLADGAAVFTRDGPDEAGGDR